MTVALPRGQRLRLNVASLRLQTAAVCGEAALIVALDPLLELRDASRRRHTVAVAVSVDCGDEWLATGDTCAVLPDEFSAGRSAVLFAGQRGAIFPYHYRVRPKSETQRNTKENKKNIFARSPHLPQTSIRAHVK